jgi:hypothetical protein
VQGTRNFRQVRCGMSLVSYVQYGGLYCLRDDCFGGGPAHPYIVWGIGLHGILADTSLGVLPKYYSGSFLLFRLVLPVSK